MGENFVFLGVDRRQPRLSPFWRDFSVQAARLELPLLDSPVARELGLRRCGLAPRCKRRNRRLTDEGGKVPLAIAGTGYGVIGILVIILLVVLILYFVRRA